MKYLGHILSVIVAFVSATLCWNIAPSLESSAVQAIASTIATVTGVLFGFVLASATIIVSASGNALVENSRRTRYLPRLMHKMQFSMLSLIASSVIFLVVLFIPRAVVVSALGGAPLFAAGLSVGVFVLGYSVGVFIMVWREFSAFARHL